MIAKIEKNRKTPPRTLSAAAFTIVVLAAIGVIMMIMTACACSDNRFVYGTDGQKVYISEADRVQVKYSRDECRAEAERLLGTKLEYVRSEHAPDGRDLDRYVFRSDDLPFELSVFSSRDAREEDGQVTLYAHAWCDYYEKVMDTMQNDADRLARKYGIEVERIRQSCVVFISGFEQLDAVYDYLDATNALYDFTLVEEEMNNILRDIRTRPALIVFYRKDGDGGAYDTGRSKVITLYYTIDHERYAYNKDALLGAMREQYISTVDRLGVSDPAVTDEIREQYVKPPLMKLCINGVPVEKKDCGEFTLDANIVFDYNWLMDGYYGDIRICAPAEDYDMPPAPTGDDRNFRYLVELLGGHYESERDDEQAFDYCTAKWWLGGSEYGAGSVLQSGIPTMTAFSKDGAGISVNHAYSKDMWGLENGYGAEDYFLRITPAALGTLLGCEAVPDYAAGTLDLITPEGYFDYTPPEPEVQYEERFFTTGVMSANALGYVGTYYVIYAADGSVMEEGTTVDYTYAECRQLTESVVMLHISGGNTDSLTFFDTDAHTSTEVYDSAALIKYPYILRSPGYEGRIVTENVLSGGRSELVDDACVRMAKSWKSFTLSPDGSRITLTYYRDSQKIPGTVDEVTETLELSLPE